MGIVPLLPLPPPNAKGFAPLVLLANGFGKVGVVVAVVDVGVVLVGVVRFVAAVVVVAVVPVAAALLLLTR